MGDSVKRAGEEELGRVVDAHFDGLGPSVYESTRASERARYTSACFDLRSTSSSVLHNMRVSLLRPCAMSSLRTKKKVSAMKR